MPRIPRMTTRRWMVVVAVVAIGFALWILGVRSRSTRFKPTITAYKRIRSGGLSRTTRPAGLAIAAGGQLKSSSIESVGSSLTMRR